MPVTFSVRGPMVLPSGAPFAIDGTPSVSNLASSATITATLSTTYGNDLIVVAFLTNGGPTISVTSSGLTFTQRGSATTVANVTQVWTAPAASPLSGQVITVTATSAAFISIVACAVSLADTVSPMDANGSNPTILTTAADPTSISTSTAADVIFGAFRMNSQPNPTQGAGFTLTGAPSGGFFLLEHKFVTSTQSGLSIPLGTGVGDAIQSVAVAFKSL